VRHVAMAQHCDTWAMAPHCDTWRWHHIATRGDGGLQHPLGLVVEAVGRMHRDDLVVLDRQIVARRLEVRNLVLGGYGRVGWHAAAPDGAEHDRRDSREYIRVLHEYTHSDSTFGVPRECSGDRSGMQRANVQVCARA
jgi:hypothetical protein